MEKTIIANAELTQMLQLSDKDFKAAIIKMLQKAITDTLETKGKRESLGKAEDIKKNQMEILEFKNTITEISKLTGWGQSRPEMIDVSVKLNLNP